MNEQGKGLATTDKDLRRSDGISNIASLGSDATDDASTPLGSQSVGALDPALDPETTGSESPSATATKRVVLDLGSPSSVHGFLKLDLTEALWDATPDFNPL